MSRQALIAAAQAGNIDLCRSLLRDGADIDATDLYGNSSLLRACARSHKEVACMLIEAGANVQLASTDTEMTPLHYAAANGWVDVCQELISRGAKVDARDKTGGTSLRRAAFWGKEDVFKLLVEIGADVHVVDHEQSSILHTVSYTSHGSLAICKLLVEKGVPVHAMDKFGRTPLLLATDRRHTALCQFLIASGADVNCPDKDGMTPLMKAASVNGAEIYAALLQAGADASYTGPVRLTQDTVTLTPFQMAVRQGSVDVVAYVIDQRIENLSQKTLDGKPLVQLAGKHHEIRTLLRAAATQRKIEAAFDAGEDVAPTKSTRSGMMPL